MRSRHHFPISALVGVGLAAVVETELAWPLVVLYAAFVGTFVDLDHFLIARVRTGSWKSLVAAVRDPRMAFFEQSALFKAGDVGPWTRLVSHVLITGVLAGALVVAAPMLAFVTPALALVTVVVLGVHVGCDLVWDYWRRRTGAL